MLNIGDIVEIKYHGSEYGVMPGAPALNLKGTIAEIVDVIKHFNSYTYRLEFIDVKAKDPNKFEESQANLLWRDEHLVLISSPKYEDIDTMDLFLQ